MSARAFILIETQVGKSQEVAAALRRMEGIKSADVITGTYDVISLIDAADMSAVADLVTGRVQAIHGVMRTITCVTAG
ncbi:MAG: Lrp/AsnC ligand binding domain-containing protein [Dehalococcoidia bacterium]|nr:Lrp/AsnC ligand binding domain-containing protein [Dehalococcoidia bacterium]MDP6228416.1 Lrp/AsnC ligand binding domain-containing protein [Dehalococcoidia bacterium]MDP7083868.1 Lrp/AsnC ligand binding domain-containing protein [Dehalococcoidia bacterium]MDP7201006.1 Lrp/AsnC ligand binding domain-containing protein [Dehalococcoidia bacterium]MDP7510571.1 Lrp/AsnC ligand binding domain-containing protein [Dehalococcoidia bacterium]